MTIGPYRIDVVETGSFALDGGAMFGVVPKPLWERAYTEPDNRNRIPMAARCLLLRSDDRTILVDTGNSPALPAKHQEIYDVKFSGADLIRSLAELNVAPSDVTDVILTHLHFDHVGGAVTTADGEAVPTFPKAWYYVQKEHYDWAMAPTDKDRASFIPELFMPLVHNGRLELLDGPGELFPMVTLDLSYGHTAALQTVRVSDGSSTLYYPADLMPTGAHVPYPFVMGYDNEPLRSISEKKHVLPIAADEAWTIVFEHDALRQAASVTLGPKGPMLDQSIIVTP
ncbi:MAG: MBL fold metallo-hydrolase [Candidatus Kapabacteria bacterium]|nr:MBL fold metallo-hydrolase [Candidatus Kapabacteria bacterium]